MHPTDRTPDCDALRRARLFELLRQQDRAEAIAARLRAAMIAGSDATDPRPGEDALARILDRAAGSWVAPGRGDAASPIRDRGWSGSPVVFFRRKNAVVAAAGQRA
jgi:hypothetical protein